MARTFTATRDTGTTRMGFPVFEEIIITKAAFERAVKKGFTNQVNAAIVLERAATRDRYSVQIPHAGRFTVTLDTPNRRKAR